ncbi:non-ribosomal peptide synthetase [Myxococcus sp. CA040A]|uniref:non-ribosomal peptide synthetase n=1 Tax=Myxococcus sp. CA040A TaxID=2741738 RepID=UPI00157B0310|nr:amino acid adenylation domain-containing protein [Myxococcus sp. CA040A]
MALDKSLSIKHAQLPRHTLVTLLQQRAETEPTREAFSFLGESGQVEQRVDYATLARQARAIAARLQAQGAVGERALLLYAPGPEYVAAFFGCLFAGMVAVPVYPPELARPERSLSRLLGIVRDSEAKWVLTTAMLRGVAEGLFAEFPELERLKWELTDELPLEVAEDWRALEVDASTVAFLQYTSGSTATPKGVVLTHANLLHNLEAIHERFGLTRQSRGVIWLPPYHDMGLIGGILAPIHGGLPVDLMSPLTFLQAPFAWLKAISDRKGTCSGGPNFAYELCARKVTEAQKATLDLSSWELAFCGAEPVRADTLDAFARAFEPCGFRREALYPCYGLAEGTLIVTGPARGRGARVRTFQREALEAHRAIPLERAPEDGQTSATHVSCGEAAAGLHVGIVDPGTRRRLEEGHVGEIWVQGQSVAQGYWRQPEATEQAFAAHVAGSDDGPWLRTGDLGFLQDGELYVTGRHKDLLIIRGRNHYPQDLELTVERSHPALRPGCAAVFARGDEATTGVVVVQELDRRYPGEDWDAISNAIRQSLSLQHGVGVDSVVLIRAGALPKTSSGKVQRSACREAWLAGRLAPVHADAPQTREVPDRLSRDDLMARSEDERRAVLIDFLSRAGKLPPGLPAHEAAHHSLGLDSLALVELKHRLERDLGVSLELRLLLGAPSLEELVTHLLEALRAAAPPPRAEEFPRDQEAHLLLTPGQRALWFLQQFKPSSLAYILARAAHIRGPLDVAALRRAFEVLVARHPSLRATFSLVGEEPIQRLHARRADLLQVVDVSGEDSHTSHARLREAAFQPFDLARGPLLRATLFSKAADEHVLLLAFHHLIADFWSLAVLVEELIQLYEGTGSEGALPPPGHPATWLQWQQQYLSSPRQQTDWEYWRQRLDGPLPLLDLPPPSPVPSARPPAPVHHFALGQRMQRRVDDFSQRHDVTPFVSLLAAFQALLHRLSGQDDLIVGTPVATRGPAGTARLVGYCVNTLPLRVDLADGPGFAALVRRTRDLVRGALEHQEFPFPLMVERLHPERVADRTPIFQTLFVHQRSPLSSHPALSSFALGDGAARLRMGGTSVELLPLPPAASPFELMLAIAPTDEGLSCAFEYDPARFDAAFIERLAAQYGHLLEAALDDADTPIARLSLLPASQREQHLLAWNDSHRSYPAGDALHALVARQARRTPDAVALVHGARRMTYGELLARASGLAAKLRRLGVGPEVRVGVFSHRTLDLVVGLLAVLEAGGAYVPLDPQYPQPRLDFIVRDARIHALLTERSLDERLPASTAHRVFLDEAHDEGTLAPEAPAEEVHPDHLAYILYTSGSTGQPKGVAISHRSAANFIHWAGEAFSDEERQGVLAGTSICFDLSVFELFATLSHGGSVILADSALHLPEQTSATVTLLNTVPSAITELLASGGIPDTVRTINLAGEPLTRELVRRLYQETKATRVVNLYGPSETTTYSTFTTLPAEPSEPVSIGGPVANTQVYVLDAHLQFVPAGVRGELFIGGAGVARGYVERPWLTAERFLPDPFSGLPGARMYRTGDHVRQLLDGTLEFLGRVDHQVKLRGFRIELGDIEAALRQEPGVRDAIVVVKGEGARRQLVAYVVPVRESTGLEVSARHLREHLRARLPEFMVPATLLVLRELPLTPNGKVDRAALPDPLTRPEDPGADYIAPRNELETRIAQVWAELLQRERVGVHDNFFDLGGNSLLATRVATRLSSALQIQASVRTVFEHRTVATLAENLAQARASSSGPSTITAQPRVPYRGG